MSANPNTCPECELYEAMKEGVAVRIRELEAALAAAQAECERLREEIKARAKP